MPPKMPRPKRAAGKPQVMPVTVLTGFLGAGKTTLLNHILESPEHGMRFAIIENELGAVGVDDKVIREECEEQIIEVMNGCICCTVRADLVQTLLRLRERVDSFDGVIIETTGLADPAPVAQTFFAKPELKKSYRLDGIITVVDAKHSLPHMREVKPDGVANEAVEQVAFADRVILNKTDLVDEPALLEVEKAVRRVNRGVEIIRAEHSRVDPLKLINIKAFSLQRVLDWDEDFLEEERGPVKHDKAVSSVSWCVEGEMNVNKLQDWISKMVEVHGHNLFRYKGVLAVKGVAEKFVFQGVHMTFNGSTVRTRWKQGEVRDNRFVFIGRNLDKQVLEAGFMACMVVGEPRFKVGDLVEANGESGWTPGKVVKLWDEGNPYRILLQNGDEVFGPEDCDDFVRAKKARVS